MVEKIKNGFNSSIDLEDENGHVWGAVFVSTSKELGKRDIILIDEKSGTHSARSITELINMLSKKNVSFIDKKRVIEFLAEQLRMLEEDYNITALNNIQKKAKEVNEPKGPKG
jgi:hypothetical protein